MKQMTFIGTTIFMLLSSCNNKPNNVETTKIHTYPKPTFLYKSLVDTVADNPYTIVSFAYKNTVEIVDTVLGSCSATENNTVPKSLDQDCKTFWAGLETTIKIDSTANSYVIKKMYVDEGSDGKDTFEVVKAFPK
jgi:hypothetical protein